MYKCECLKSNREYYTQYAYSYEEYPLSLLDEEVLKANKYYASHLMTFDIETSKYEVAKDEYTGFMYHWQICLDGNVIFGRRWSELISFIKSVQEYLHLKEDKKKLVCYVHNLSYEFHFLYNIFKITNVFALDTRKVLRCTLDESIELRCSYYLSNMSLAKFIENSPNAQFIKAKDDLDYSVLRTPNTQLTPRELGYCYNDVKGLYECIMDRLNEDNLKTIPLTSTGYVRRNCRNAMRKNSKNKQQFQRIKLNRQQYDLLRECFRGGNTGSNRYLTNIILDNVSSWDMTSAYPYVLLSEKYPISKFMPYEIDTRDELEKLNKKYCTIGRYVFHNVRLKSGVPIPYLPFSKCIKIRFHGENKDEKISKEQAQRGCIYNGRVLKCEYVITSFTNIDFDIFKEQYDFDDMYIDEFYFARKGRLPQELLDQILLYFTDKSKLKGIAGKEYEYSKSKNQLNGIYGMMVTAIDRTNILFDENEEEIFKSGEKQTLEEYYDSKNSFLSYQWGVYVTAYCRKNLQQAIDKIGLDVVYCDTDSVKYIGNHDDVFESINEEWKEKNKDIIWYTDVNDKRYYLGLYDKEPSYIQFITLGAKKYAYKYINKKGTEKLGVTVSGLSKEKGAKELERKGGLSHFRNGEIFIDSGRTTIYYNNEPPHILKINDEEIYTGANVVILDTTYTLGITDTMLDIIVNSRKEKYDK